MQPVSLDILKVIKAIDAARNQAERNKDNERRCQIIHLQQMIAEEDWRKNECVLEPLQRTE